MPLVETVILRDPWDVDRRLHELQLDRPRLITVCQMALASAANATPFHPANAAGTFAYQNGTWALRNEFVGRTEWTVSRIGGVEAIRNPKIAVNVVFANVDIACDDNQKPKPRSPKGSGAEKVCEGNLFGWLPDYAPAPQDTDGFSTYYLMVAENGAAELTRPVIENKTFVAYLERIYLSSGDDLDRDSIFDDSDVVDDFDPVVVRK